MPNARALPVLVELDARVEARVEATRAAHPWWPCGAGCDRCCRSLARLLEISRPEWERVRVAIDALPPADRAEVLRRIAEARRDETTRVCPLLDEDRGLCRIYDARPIACRTYGYYADRDGGQHCAEVGSAVADHEDGEPVIWGNGASIEVALDALAPRRTITAWMTHSSND